MNVKAPLSPDRPPSESAFDLAGTLAEKRCEAILSFICEQDYQNPLVTIAALGLVQTYLADRLTAVGIDDGMIDPHTGEVCPPTRSPTSLPSSSH
jgi:hypothetical protein